MESLDRKPGVSVQGFGVGVGVGVVDEEGCLAVLSSFLKLRRDRLEMVST